MTTKDFSKRIVRKQQVFLPGESYFAWIPPPLPPDPPLDLGQIAPTLLKATEAVARLDGISSILPNTALFLYMYVRKEALVSAQIEGTQSSFSDLLLFEIEEPKEAAVNEVEDVSNYITAMNHGLRRLREGFPLSLRLLREIHERLLAKGRGADRRPGEFRTSQNWIGGSRPGNAIYVPPPVDALADGLRHLERFLHEPPPFGSPLVQAALAHVQFESLHPFLDGNGRLGRLLTTFLLCSAGVLSEPVLYLSLYLKRRRRDYYDLLQAVRERGIWEEWVEFFLNGVRETGEQAVESARQIHDLIERDRAKIAAVGRLAPNALRLHELLTRHPLTPIGYAARQLNLTVPTVTDAVGRMVELGILEEVTGRRRGKLFRYSAYLSILDEGTEPLRELAVR